MMLCLSCGRATKFGSRCARCSDGARPRAARRAAGLYAQGREARCELCGSDQNVQIDHVVPLARGGSIFSDNLQILCRSCNAHKGAAYDPT